jgi:hypothetical protein
VYSPENHELVHLNDPEKHPMGSLLQNYPNKNFLGDKMDHDFTLMIARGTIEPNSRKYYDVVLREIAK